jgi:hypothetical protein
MAYLDPAQGAIREGIIPPMDPAPAVADAGAATSTAAAGATPTKAEFDALRTDYLALRTKVNALLASLRTGEFLAP